MIKVAGCHRTSTFAATWLMANISHGHVDPQTPFRPLRVVCRHAAPTFPLLSAHRSRPLSTTTILVSTRLTQSRAYSFTTPATRSQTKTSSSTTEKMAEHEEGSAKKKLRTEEKYKLLCMSTVVTVYMGHLSDLTLHRLARLTRPWRAHPPRTRGSRSGLRGCRVHPGCQSCGRSHWNSTTLRAAHSPTRRRRDITAAQHHVLSRPETQAYSGGRPGQV